MKRLLPALLSLLLLISSAQASILPAEGVQQGFLSFTGMEGRRAVVLCESLSVCDAREGKKIATLQFGDHFIVTESWDGWATCYASDGSISGWVRSDYIMIDPAYYVTDDDTPVYAWGNTLAPRVALLDPGETLPILLDREDWVVVSLRGAAGWIKKTPKDTVSETYFRPEMLQNITHAALTWNNQYIELTDPYKLSELSQLLTSVEDRGAPIAGCPFGATLRVTSGGQSYELSLAVDSCCIYRIDNRDYSYARNRFTSEGAPDNDVLFGLFGVAVQ